MAKQIYTEVNKLNTTLKLKGIGKISFFVNILLFLTEFTSTHL